MNKYIAFRAKVVFAILASIPIEWTHTLTYVCSGRVLERPCTGVAGRARHAVQGRPAPKKKKRGGVNGQTLQLYTVILLTRLSTV